MTPKDKEILDFIIEKRNELDVIIIKALDNYNKQIGEFLSEMDIIRLEKPIFDSCCVALTVNVFRTIIKYIPLKGVSRKIFISYLDYFLRGFKRALIKFYDEYKAQN